MDQRIIEGIEACRPGTEDLRAPDLSDVARAVEQDPAAARLYDRVQTWDSAVVAAVDDVPVPAGLADRLVARLREAAAAQSSLLQSTVEQVAAASQVSSQTDELVSVSDQTAPGTSASRWTRRRWLTASASVAALVLTAFLVGSWLQPGEDTSIEALADRWQQQLTANWQDMRKAPGDLAVPSQVMASVDGWQKVGIVGGARGAAYKLIDSKGNTALLYVVRMPAAGLPLSPPQRPQSTTAGKAVGYWQNGGIVYVLVVDPGNERTYRGFVTASSAPLA